MPYLTNLAKVARGAGLNVVEVSGWQTRGHGAQPTVEGVVCHHTAGRDDLRVVVSGRSDLKGPLSHFWLKHDGTVYVVAAGRCWHNAPSTSVHHANSTSIGIEAENDGRTPWPRVQLDAYVRLCAALCLAYGLPAARVKGHKEVNDGKPDPHTIKMNVFRDEVSRVMAELKGAAVSLSKEDVLKMWRTDGAIDALDGHPENTTWQAQSGFWWLNKQLVKVLANQEQILNQQETMLAEIRALQQSKGAA